MTTVKVAAVQAAYVLMDQAACVAKVIDLVGQAAELDCRIVVFPEAFVPGTPIWIDSRPIWDGDEEWFALLVDQAVVVPGPVTEELGAAARSAGVYLVIGVQEREPHGSTIYNTVLYFGPDGALLGKQLGVAHRVLEAIAEHLTRLLGRGGKLRCLRHGEPSFRTASAHRAPTIRTIRLTKFGPACSTDGAGGTYGPIRREARRRSAAAPRPRTRCAARRP